jgi:hypothetical protein
MRQSVGWLLGCAALMSGCHRLDARGVTERLIIAIDLRDADRAIELQVSGEQLAQLVACATANPDTRWLTSAARAETLAKRRAEYADAQSSHVRLEPLFEEYGRDEKGSLWKAYRVGDVVSGDCRAKAAFSREWYRITLAITDFRSETDLTEPIELWNIDGSYYVWEDPMDTAGWR